MPTLLSGGNIFPVGPKLRPGWLGAALRVQKLSWICFLRVLHLPSSWPFPFPDYNFCTAQNTSWHQLGSKPTDLFGVKWKKITNERRKKSKCWKKNIWTFTKWNVLTKRLETGRNLHGICKNKPKITLSTPQIIRSLGWDAAALHMSVCPSFRAGERVYRRQRFMSLRIYPSTSLNSSSFDWVELSFSLPVDI